MNECQENFQATQQRSQTSKLNGL